MPGRVTKAKGHRQKGEKKKKEERVLPLVVDVGVNLPSGKQLELKGITTDKLLDVRQLLVQNVETIHLTNYSFSHEVRGHRLPDNMEVTALKPCVLDLVEEDYTEASVIVHIRRLLDIVACTTFFGPSKQEGETEQPATSSEQPEATSAWSNSRDTPAGEEVQEDREATATDGKVVDNCPKGLGLGLAKKKKEAESPATEQLEKALQVVDKSVSKVTEGGKETIELTEETKKAAKAMAEAEAAAAKGNMTGMCPPSQLGSFHEFFSMSHLTPPLQSIRKSSRALIEPEGALMAIDVKLCNGKLVPVIACVDGFVVAGKPASLEHSLLDLLKRQSGAFTSAYDALMKAFEERNQFGNVPIGFRHNTWVSPAPFISAPASTFPAFPVEDETWGGNGGGGGLQPLTGVEGGDEGVRWAAQFEALARLPCATQEERVVRDKKAFLLHNLFADVALRSAAAAASSAADAGQTGEVELTKGNLLLRVLKDNPVTVGGDCQVSNSGPFRVVRDGAVLDKERSLPGQEKFDDVFLKEELDRRNLLKGLTADESAAVQDLPTLGMVVMHHRGYTVRVNALGKQGEGEPEGVVVEVDQPEGGANALNINSLRTVLSRPTSSTFKTGNGIVKQATEAEYPSNTEAEAEKLVKRVLEDSLAALAADEEERQHVHRWELGACWLQHLQNPPAASKEQGVAKEGKNAKETKAEESVKEETNKEKAAREEKERHNQEELKARLSEDAFKRLADSKTGLHLKSLDELVAGALEYYHKTALPKLVADFGSLELSPVDGRTLTEFMHTRGLNMCSLGAVAEEAKDLIHVRSLAVHEMVTRAFKHILRAVIAAIPNASAVAPAVAAALNACLGANEKDDTESLASLAWKWTQAYCSRQFSFELPEGTREDLRKLSVLRGLANKVGLEIAPRDFKMETTTSFKAADIIALFPVYKQVACTSADGRALLEQSKTALDKGKLDDAVTFGAKALAKLIAVCGPRHRMTAGAYSLLAVVLYHTGDFNQATIYQQKALDINERELGLDHPDTMKSYGDLAVFYYRLQHTELALKYVNRALYLLHLTCGPDHPNTVATYINVAMMEEGMGNIPLALRYLHEALNRNKRLLGADHIQTAASYHAIAIALSLMEAYALSVQNEQITLQILQEKLGPDDLRTQDAAAWLEYFDSKAVEQLEAARTGARKPDASIASKGHLSVDDLLKYINKGAPDSPSTKKPLPRPPARRLPSRAAKTNPPAESSSSIASSSSSDEEESDKSLSDAPYQAPQESSGWPTSPAAAPEVLAGAVAAPAPAMHAEDNDDGGEWQPAAPRSKALPKRPTLGRKSGFQQQLRSPSRPFNRGRPWGVKKDQNMPSPGSRNGKGAGTKSKEQIEKPAEKPKVLQPEAQPVFEKVVEAPVAESADSGQLKKALSWKEVALAPPGARYTRPASPGEEGTREEEEGSKPQVESVKSELEPLLPAEPVGTKRPAQVPKPDEELSSSEVPRPPSSEADSEEGVEIKTVDPASAPPQGPAQLEVPTLSGSTPEKAASPLNPKAPEFKMTSPKPLNPAAPVFQVHQGVLPTPIGGPQIVAPFMPPLYPFQPISMPVPHPFKQPHFPPLTIMVEGAYSPPITSPSVAPMNPNAAEFVPGRNWTPSPPLIPTPVWPVAPCEQKQVEQRPVEDVSVLPEGQRLSATVGEEQVAPPEAIASDDTEPVEGATSVETTAWTRARSWANVLDSNADMKATTSSLRKEVSLPSNPVPVGPSSTTSEMQSTVSNSGSSEGSDDGSGSNDDGFVTVTRKKRKEKVSQERRSRQGGFGRGHLRPKGENQEAVGLPAKPRTGGAGRERVPAAQVVSVR